MLGLRVVMGPCVLGSLALIKARTESVLVSKIMANLLTKE